MSGRRRGEGGAIAILSAVISLTLLVVAAFAVDIGHTWAERGKLQFQADKAALLAAEALPAADAASRLEVAKYAAYYIACHPRPGQRKLSAIPGCPDGTTPGSTEIVAYGQELLDEGLVSFPTSTQVKVVTPPAYIDYGFGKAAGADGTTQQKMAIAKVSSPGDILPFGLSLTCVASFLGSAPVGLGDATSGVLPLNYLTTGNDSSTGGTVDEILDLDRFLGCGRVLQSPRNGASPAPPDITANIRGGLNHRLVRHPSLVQALDGLNLSGTAADSADEVTGILQNPSLILECTSSEPANILDIQSQINAGRTPNCVRLNGSNNNEVQQVTDGFLTQQGRLSCSVSPCPHGEADLSTYGFSGTYNADTFDDFVTGDVSVLEDQMFFAMSTYLQPEVPVVTPTSAIDPSIYSSPRFFWVPVVSSVFTTEGSEDYPILTFRPVFMSAERSEEASPATVVDGLVADLGGDLADHADCDFPYLDCVLNDVLGELGTLLGSEEGVNDLLDEATGVDQEERHGLVFKKESSGDWQLRSIRFMTIEPGALPPVDFEDYDGVTTDYVGVGPKIVQLVK